MEAILNKAIAYADFARDIYPKTGRMPKFSDVPPGVKTPSGGTITIPVAPLTPEQEKALSQKSPAEMTLDELNQEEQRLLRERDKAQNKKR
jgi:hypothetical protein